MNAIYTRITILSLLFMCSFSSCKKEKTSSGTGEFTSLRFDLLGIEESPELIAGVGQGEEGEESLLKEAGEFEILTTTKKNYIDPEVKFDKKLRAASMATGVKYRIELFKVEGSSQVHIKTLDRTSGQLPTTNDTVAVQHGNRYKWYAYSYNTTDPITLPIGTSVVPMGENKDFVYAKGEFEVTSYSNNNISITFKRKTARVRIEVDARGANADTIKNLRINIPTGFVKSANFNLFTNGIDGPTSNVPINILATKDFTHVNGAHRMRSGFIHTVVGGAVSTINTDSLGIVVRNNFSTRPVRVLRDLAKPETPLNFSFANAILDIGKSTLLKVDLLESGLTYGGVTWARSNLYMHSNTGDNRYRFYPENIQIADPRTFFSFKGFIPLTIPEKTGTKDPCALVYPAGRWKSPTIQEFEVTSANPLIQSRGILTNLVNVLLALLGKNFNQASIIETQNNSKFIRYTTYERIPNTLFSDNSTYLQFPLNGEHVVANLANISQLTVLDLNLGSTAGRYAALWTRQSDVELPFAGLSLGGWAYQGGESTTLSKYAVGAAAALADITLLGLNVLSSDFKNIRCTRDLSWDPDASMASREPVY